MTPAGCIAPGCQSPVLAQGLCNAHYKRARKSGEISTRPLSVPFWDRVARGSADECWPWMGALNAAGYGVYHDPATGRSVGAHRHASILTFGPIDGGRGGLWVLHRCDNPPCCNPGHHFLGTPAANMSDMVAKGRNRPGGHLPVRPAA